MSIYIDRPAWHWRGRLWSHLISDTSLDELHAFARDIPLRYLSFGIDHYDVPEELFDRCLEMGAEFADARDLIRHLRSSGLRRSRGKLARTWQQIELSEVDFESQQQALVLGVLADWRLESGDFWVVGRPGTSVIACEFYGREHPDLSNRADLLEAGIHTVTTEARDGLLVELVVGEF